jgi:hypothetical protein
MTIQRRLCDNLGISPVLEYSKLCCAGGGERAAVACRKGSTGSRLMATAVGAPSCPFDKLIRSTGSG